MGEFREIALSLFKKIYIRRSFLEETSIDHLRTRSGFNNIMIVLDTNTYSTIVYVIPTVVGISAILLFAILTLFYIRNKKIVRERKSKTLTQMAEKEPQEGTLSSTASFLDEKKTILESPIHVPPKKTSCSNTDAIKKSKVCT